MNYLTIYSKQRSLALALTQPSFKRNISFIKTKIDKNKNKRKLLRSAVYMIYIHSIQFEKYPFVYTGTKF